MNKNDHSNKKIGRLQAAFAAVCGLGLLVWFTGAHNAVGDLVSDLRSYGPDRCAGIGDVCPDGSVYAGRTPDGNMFMFATPEDAPNRLPWSIVPGLPASDMENCAVRRDVGQRAASCSTGRANTALLAAQADASPSYPAANYCAALDAHGHGDWYLPAIDELGVLYRNRARVGGFKLSHEWSKPMQQDVRIGTYWSSSEYRDTSSSNIVPNLSVAVARDFAGMNQEDHLYAGKGEALRVRCVRQEPVPGLRPAFR